ncbi:flagellar hook-basal body complex protein FliE [Desnuesiella massiliensis]|uniref:flagellar hook-basal body complex protein FliE n=1 Tax=Desnuesiella massiliensis TaxID=1650662 RepID=UPI0006E41703|nr:flagellar hook-basal body complex protein FliE [Desnuesiella massiliensis]
MKINEFVPSGKIFDSMSVDTKKNNIGSESENFADMLKNNLDKVNEKQLSSEELSQKFLRGEDVDIHEVMIASEEARISLQMAVQIRNKLVEAYQELNRMQL